MLEQLLLTHYRLQPDEWLVIEFGGAELAVADDADMYYVIKDGYIELVVDINGYIVRIPEHEILDFYIDRD